MVETKKPHSKVIDVTDKDFVSLDGIPWLLKLQG